MAQCFGISFQVVSTTFRSIFAFGLEAQPVLDGGQDLADAEQADDRHRKSKPRIASCEPKVMRSWPVISVHADAPAGSRHHGDQRLDRRAAPHATRRRRTGTSREELGRAEAQGEAGHDAARRR
jgi:hypothetical protein